MKITSLTAQVRNPDRVNVSVDGKYLFSLDITQVVDFKIKVGNDYSELEIADFEAESIYGKLYARALEYSLMRPRSVKEVRDYLYRKTLDRRVRSRHTGELKTVPGVSRDVTARVLDKLVSKGYVDDTKFAQYWVSNRNLRKGISRRKIEQELAAKGVDRGIVATVLGDSDRSDVGELDKVIAKKLNKYDSQEKLITYLMRRGFNYDDVKQALSEQD